MFQEAVDLCDLLGVEAQASQERVARAKRQRLRHDLKLKVRRVVQLHDHFIQVSQNPEGRDQAVVTAAARAGQKIYVIRVIAVNELIEILLTDHQTVPLDRLERKLTGGGTELHSSRS